MRLIAILLALILHRFWQQGNKLQRYDWVDLYAERLSAKVKMPPVVRFLVLIALPVVVLWLVILILRPWTFGLLGLLINFLILWYSIGHVPWRRITSAVESTEVEIVAAPSLIWQYQEGIYSVIFWYILLGPMGALLYRLSLEIKRLCLKLEYQDMSAIAALSKDLLDWLPVRFIGLGFTLAGNFMASFSYWLDHLLMPQDANKAFLTEIGLRAIQVSATGEGVEQRLVFALLERTLWILIAVIAIFTIGSWLY